MPSEFKDFFDEWKALHPDYELILWNEEQVRALPLICKIPFRYVRDMGQLSDIARYEILRLFGGFYIDLDVKLFRPLEPLRETGARLIYADHKTGDPTNFFLGATKNHPAMIALCNQINRDFPFLQKGRNWARRLDYKFATTIFETGPCMLTDVSVRFFGRKQKTSHTEYGFLIGEPGSYHSTLAIWPECFPHGNAPEGPKAFGRHLTYKSWHKKRIDSDETVIYNEALDDVYGIYQLDLPSDALIIDAGAHKGLFGVLCRKLWPNATIVCIEPNSANWGALTETAQELGLSVSYEAISNQTGTLNFSDDADHSARGKLDPFGTNQVECRLLSSKLEGVKIDIGLLKLDVEGAELGVLMDLRDSGWLAKTKHVRIETHEFIQQGITNACVEILKPTHEISHVGFEHGGSVGMIYADLL